MRIAFVVASLANKGPVVLVRDLALALMPKVEEVVVFYFDKRDQELTFPCETRKISFFHKASFEGFDIVHSHGIRPDAFLLMNRNRIAGKTLSTIHIYMKDDLKHTYNAWVAMVIPFFWRQLWRRHDRIVTLSKHMTEYYAAQSVEKGKLTHVYNGRHLSESNDPIPKQDLEKISGISNGHTTIGLVGFLTDRKGTHQLVNVLSIDQRLALLVVGDGPSMQNLQKLAASKNVLDRTCFLGYRGQPERYLPLMDIYVMASYSEGFPLVLIEAGLKKKRVVCADTTLFRELFNESEVVFFQLDDVNSLRDAIQLALRQPDLAENLYKKIQSSYSVGHMAEAHIRLYESVSTPLISV